MSLDNALRGALLREGDAIAADARGAVPLIAGRVSVQRRRRAARAASAVVLAALVVWAPPRIHTSDDVNVPPAEQRPAPIERRNDPRPDPEPTRRPREKQAQHRLDRRATSERTRAIERRASGPAAARSGGNAQRGDAGAPVEAVARQILERYDVNYVVGTHVGENAGAGCWKGQSATGSNDCIAINVGADESQISLRLVDDGGVRVGATVYEYVEGERAAELSFCGDTGGYLDVEPGALLLVYLDTSTRCSSKSPDTGILEAFLR